MRTSPTPQKISVIGAGIMGLTCAYVLSQHFGPSVVTLYDQDGFPADNASFMAGGMLAPYSELDHLPASFLEAGFESIAYWHDFSHQTNADFEFAQNGSLLLAHESDRHLLERFKVNLPPATGQNASKTDIAEMEPYFAGKFSNGLFFAQEAHLHPQKLMQFLLNQIQNKVIQTIDIKKEKQNADWVIDCRGMGAAQDNLTMRGVKGETLTVYNPEFSLSRPVRLMHPRYPLYIVPRANHVFMIGATIIESDHENTVSIRSGLELLSAAFSLHPSFCDAKILEMKAGIRPAYPDNLPHISVKENIISCNGLYRHGYLLSPIMAKCAKALILNEDCGFINLFLKENYDEHSSERKTAFG